MQTTVCFFKVLDDDETKKGTFEDLPSNNIVFNEPSKNDNSEKSVQDCDLYAPVENSEITEGNRSQKEIGDYIES